MFDAYHSGFACRRLTRHGIERLQVLDKVLGTWQCGTVLRAREERVVLHAIGPRRLIRGPPANRLQGGPMMCFRGRPDGQRGRTTGDDKEQSTGKCRQGCQCGGGCYARRGCHAGAPGSSQGNIRARSTHINA